MPTRTVVLRTAAAAALAAALTACGGAPAAIAIADACAATNDGRAVVLEGALAARSSMACNDYDGTFRCMLDITDPSGKRAGIDIAVGGGGSAMDEPARRFTPESLKVRAEDGSPVAVGDRVRVTGEMSVASSQVCFVTAERIERV